jgi:16S rRNA (guanine966-N2)-methyltransferase
VTRIISGLVGSLKLKAAAKSTRPTSDRVKESLFSILESIGALEDAEVLDLYAGTGALGLEAASRGAKSVWLVENNSAAAKVCKENLNSVKSGLARQGCHPELLVFQESAERFLNRGLVPSLVFIDPPYEVPNQELTNQLSKLGGKDLLVVLERSSKTDRLELPAGFELLTERSYGDTAVYLITRVAD